MPKTDADTAPETETEAETPPDARAATRVVDLVDRVARALGRNRKDVRDTVSATLAALGTALDAGEVLNLPPLGKIRVNRAKTVGSGLTMTLKLRRAAAVDAEKGAKLGLVEPDEAG